MLHSGLVSVSFRSLSPREIIDLTVRAGLEGIEWGGDIHVPQGDIEKARQVQALTTAARLTVAAYGSYYRAGEPARDGNPDFTDVLATARMLQAPVIRVWCGRKGSADADAAYRRRVLDDLERIGALAAEANIAIACEHHAGTLTDTDASAVAMYAELAGANVHPYWQPAEGLTPAQCLAGLEALLPTLLNLHVFMWKRVEGKRLRCPLAEGEDLWLPWLQRVARDGREHWALLEFVKDDSPEQFLEDAATLRRWLQSLPCGA